jgi:poly(A) polymerase
MTKITAIMRFLSQTSRRLGVGDHVYVVGGAVRNHLMGLDPKDLDLVVDSIALGGGRDSGWFAEQLQRAIPAHSTITTNNYGVAILTVHSPWQLGEHKINREVFEIANARLESYGGAAGKGYKPDHVEPATIQDDLKRREFTFNTLLWRLQDLEDGPAGAPVLDLLGTGRQDLEAKVIRTPVDPNKTFSDDPTRMLRAIKFVARYGFVIPPEIRESIAANAPKLKKMPWDAVRKILTEDLFGSTSPRLCFWLLQTLWLGPVIKEMLAEEKGFASALGRALPSDGLTLLDIVDAGWPVKTPVSSLDGRGFLCLREILEKNAQKEPAVAVEFEKRFMEMLQRPPIDQLRLFETFNIKGQERGSVIQTARQILLDQPQLVDDPTKFEQLVEQRIKACRQTERKSPIS